MKRHNTITLLVFWVVVQFHLVYPQAEQYKFHHLSTEDGLPTNLTTAVMKDSRGFIWITTHSGLCRYDGYAMKVFQYDPSDTTTLSSNSIMWPETMVEDKNGCLWIATEDGLNKFDPVKETFQRYRHIPGDPGSLSFDEVMCLYVDREGTLWLGAGYGQGLNRYNPARDDFTVFDVFTEDDTARIKKSVNSIYEDSKGVLWVGTSHGLYQFDRQKESFTRIDTPPESFDPSNPILYISIYEDSESTLYVGTLNGIRILDRKTNELINFKPLYDQKNDFLTLDIQEDPYHEGHPLWISAKKVYQYLPPSGKLSELVPDPKNPESIKGNYIKSAFVDDSGILWLAGDQGVNKGIPRNDHMKAMPEFFERFGDAVSFFEDRQHFLWVGTDRYLVCLDTELNPVKSYYFFNETEKIGKEVNCIYKDRLNNLWVGTWLDGLYCLENGKDEFVKCKFTNTVKDVPHKIYKVYEDSGGRLWVCTFPYGLYHQEDKVGSITSFTNDSLQTPLHGMIVNDVLEDRSGNLWLSTHGHGIVLLPLEYRDRYNFKQYQKEPGNESSLSDNITHAIYEEDEHIWIASANGLNRYVPETDGFERYYNENDPGLNVVHDVSGDHKGNLWLTTESGLVHTALSRENKVDQKRYSLRKLFSFHEYNRYFLYQDKRGRLFLGGQGNGFIYFYPDSLEAKQDIPPVVIVDFSVHGSTIDMDSSILYKKKITLKHNQDFFSFRFATLDYMHPEKNQFAYKLEGLEENWIYSGNRQFVNYTNIPPGEYTFRVMGSNGQGYWNEEGSSVNIIVSSAPWNTWWAYTIYLLLLLFIATGIVRFYIRRQQLIHRLELERVQTEKLEELDHMKSRFFANISHEFRTPLTLILGPLEKLKSKIHDAESKNDLNSMQRSARRLLNLISQLLNLSKLESGQMKLRAREEDLVSLVKNYTQSFESLAKQKNIDLVFSAARDTLKIYVEKEKIETILYNLLSNAFKFTENGGVITVEVGLSKLAFMRISDTGKGIPGAKMKHIFDRFYQGDDDLSRAYQGTGIGLALTRELVDLHHGKIEVESEPNTGTTFTVFFLLGKDHLKPEEMDLKENSGDEPENMDKQEEVAVITPGSYTPGKIEEDDLYAQDDSKPLLLLVEDNDDLRSYIRSHLNNAYRIVESNNGITGLEKAVQRIPDIVLSDIMMPGMDGVEMCTRLKADERTSHIPVILLTARAGKESKIESLETGADDFIVKPFDIDELTTRIKNLVEQRRKLREQWIKNAEEIGLSRLLNLPAGRITSLDQQFLEKAIHVIEHHLDDFDFTVEQFSQDMALSQMQLYRKLKALVDQSANEFIRSIRLRHAAELIKQEYGNIAQISYAVGFNNPSYFAECFKKKFGKPPSEYIPQK